MSVPSDTDSGLILRRESLNTITIVGLIVLVGLIGFSRFLPPAAPVPLSPAAPPVPIGPTSCQRCSLTASRPFRVTCPTCHYDLTVVPPILPTGDFGKVAKTGTGELPK